MNGLGKAASTFDRAASVPAARGSDVAAAGHVGVVAGAGIGAATVLVALIPVIVGIVMARTRMRLAVHIGAQSRKVEEAVPWPVGVVEFARLSKPERWRRARRTLGVSLTLAAFGVLCAGFLVVGVAQELARRASGLHGAAAVAVVCAVLTVVSYVLVRCAVTGWAGGLVRYGRWWTALWRGAAAVPQQLVRSAE